MRAYMQRLKKGTTAVHFSAQKKLKKRHQSLKKPFYEFLEHFWHPELYFFGILNIYLAS